MDAPADTHRPPPVLLAALGLIVIGSIGSWVGGDSIAAKDGLEGDGVITIALALIAAAILVVAALRARGVPVITVGICIFLVLAIAIYDTLDILGTDLPFDDISVGWGLWLVVAGSIVALGALVVARRTRA